MIRWCTDKCTRMDVTTRFEADVEECQRKIHRSAGDEESMEKGEEGAVNKIYRHAAIPVYRKQIPQEYFLGCRIGDCVTWIIKVGSTRTPVEKTKKERKKNPASYPRYPRSKMHVPSKKGFAIRRFSPLASNTTIRLFQSLTFFFSSFVSVICRCTSTV